MSGGRLTGLDGLRGVAAIGVMTMHAHLAALPVAHGYLAVDLFYLLSGYVIARSYEPALQRGAAGGGLDLAGYVRVRLERLYPMLFAGGLLGIALYLGGAHGVSPMDEVTLAWAIIGQLLLIPLLAGPATFAFNGAQWSIVHELVANVVHAVLLPWLGTRVLLGIAALSAAGLVLTAHHFGSIDAGWTRESFVWAFARVGFGFFLGVWLHRVEGRWRHRMPRLPLWFPAAVLVMVINLPGDWLPDGDGYAAYDLACVVVLFPVLVMLGVEAAAGTLAEELGALSYPLYAVHFPVLMALRGAGAEPALVIAVIPALLAVSWALGRWVDEPLNRWRRRVRTARAGRPGQAAQA